MCVFIRYSMVDFSSLLVLLRGVYGYCFSCLLPYKKRFFRSFRFSSSLLDGLSAEIEKRKTRGGKCSFSVFVKRCAASFLSHEDGSTRPEPVVAAERSGTIGIALFCQPFENVCAAVYCVATPSRRGCIFCRQHCFVGQGTWQEILNY